MNQILITKKLYITPELKRKKKIYKFDFILSIFLVIVLISIYIYAEYDRNKNEEVSQEILEEMRQTPQVAENSVIEDTTVAKDDTVLLIVLDDEEGQYNVNTNYVEEPVHEQEQHKQQESQPEETQTYQPIYKTTDDGYTYAIVATISIPSIDVEYAILEGETGSAEETDALLEISPCKFWGPNINEVGNYCIVGHNYRNSMFFSKVPTLEIGDTFTIEEPYKRTLTYQIYDKYEVEPTNRTCTSQLTGGRKEVTLITCTDNAERRVVIKAREVK